MYWISILYNIPPNFLRSISDKDASNLWTFVDQDGRSCTGTVGSLTSGSPGLLLDPPSSSMNGGLVVLSLGDLRSLCGNPKALCTGRAPLAEYTEAGGDELVFSDDCIEECVESVSIGSFVIIIMYYYCSNGLYRVKNDAPRIIYIHIKVKVLGLM